MAQALHYQPKHLADFKRFDSDGLLDRLPKLQRFHRSQACWGGVW